MWRLCRSCVHLRILRGCYINALQNGVPSCHTGKGTAPPFVLGHKKSLSSAVHPGPEGAAHWKEGNASEVILPAFSHCRSNDFGSLWWRMCCIYQYPENVNWLWQYNIFWMYNFPIEILCSFHWLSLAIRMFWKVIDVFHKGIQIAVEPVDDISAYKCAITLWSYHLAHVFVFGSFLSGHLYPTGLQTCGKHRVWLCCQTSVLLQLIKNRDAPVTSTQQ